MPLTDSACRNLKPSEKPRKVADANGLYLQIMPNGSKYWRLKYRYADKEKRLAIGVYPEVSLLEARDRRDAARRLLRDGIDPSQSKQETKRQIVLNAENNFKALAIEWHEHQKEKWSAKHAKDILIRLEKDIFPVIGRLPIKDIGPQVLLKNIQAIEKRGAHEMARRAQQYCSQIFRYAIVTGRVDRNPATELKGALKPYKKGHYASLETKALPDFIAALKRNDARLFLQTRLGIELMMLTFVRTGELIKSQWSEFDLKDKTWFIPAERMKMRRPHIVPLSTQALHILEQLKPITGHSEWVFASHAKPRQHMSNNTILHAIAALGYKGQMTGHGFRALAMSTIKEKLGYRHEVIDRQLAHAHKSQIDAAYDRAQFLDDRRKMMQEWADYLDKAATGKKVITGESEAVAA